MNNTAGKAVKSITVIHTQITLAKIISFMGIKTFVISSCIIFSPLNYYLSYSHYIICDTKKTSG